MVNKNGVDLVFSDNRNIEIDQIFISDDQKRNFPIETLVFSKTDSVFSVELDGEINMYYLMVKDDIIDTLNANFELVSTDCCGTVFKLDTLSHSAAIHSIETNLGAVKIIVP